jgi:hypothetical protein
MPNTDSARSPAAMTDTEILDEAAALATRPEPLTRADLGRLRTLQATARRRGLDRALDQRVADACVAAATKLVRLTRQGK